MMACTSWMFLLLLASCWLTVTTGFDNSDSGLPRYVCGVCGAPINVTLKVHNQLKHPRFKISIDLINEPQRELIHHLSHAADLNKNFTFNAKYFSDMGFMITSFLGVEASTVERTYWSINSPNGNALLKGASSLLPQNNEVIIFNYTSY